MTRVCSRSRPVVANSHLEFFGVKGAGRVEVVALRIAGVRVTCECVTDEEKVAAIEQRNKQNDQADEE